MNYKVSVHPHVRKFLNSLDPETRTRLVEGLRKMENNPLDKGCLSLQYSILHQDQLQKNIIFHNTASSDPF